MNRYPWWKYAILGVALLIGLLYTVPNLYGEAPAVQVSSGKVTVKIDGAMVQRVEQALTAAGLKSDFVQFDGNSVRARFGDTDTQLKAKDVIAKALNPDPTDPSSSRLPPFFRMDLRLEKRWQLGPRAYFSFIAEWMNATLSKEAISTTCTLQGCQTQTIGPITIPSLGIEGGF